MTMKEVFALAGTISVDASGAIKNIDKATKHAKKSESKFERTFSNIKKLARAYLSGTAIWNFGKSMVEAAADVQATNAQFAAAFKDLSGSASEAFARVEEVSGTLSSRLMTTGTKAFSQFTGAGMDSTKALGKMEEYLNLATDGAAYYDLSLEEVDERLRSFLRGNTEAGDAIGLFTSEAQRNAKANEMYGKSFIKLSEDQKQLVMLDITKSIYDASGATEQASREANGYANVVGNLKEQWKQFLAQVGTPVLQAVIPILKAVGEALQSLAPIFTTITTFLVENKDLIIDILIAIGSAITTIGLLKVAVASYNAVMKIVNVVTGAYRAVTLAMSAANVTATTTTKLLTTAQLLLNKAFKANPIGIVITIIGLLVAALVTLYRKNEDFRNLVQKVWSQITQYIKTAWEKIKVIWDKVKPYFEAIWSDIKTGAKNVGTLIKTQFQIAWEAVKLAWNNAKAFFQMVWNTIRNIFKVVKSVLTGDFRGAWQGIKNIFSGVKQFFQNTVNNIVNAFKNIGQKIWNNFSGVFSRIWDGIKNIGGNIASGAKKLLGFAGGGVFTGESAIRVAEYPNATTNPEIVTPQNIMRDTFAETLDNYSFSGGSSNESSRILALLEEYLPTMAQMKMVLSTGELVGAITPRIDKSLGERSQRKERGRV